MELTQKQRLLVAARGERLDKVPFGARIDLWYNYNLAHDALPEKYKGWSQIDIIRDLGAGVHYRWSGMIKERYQDMEVIERNDPPYKITEFLTPLGCISRKLMFNPYEGHHVGYEVEKLFKSKRDYPILKYVLKHTTPVINFEEYSKICEEVGESGLVVMGGCYSPVQHVMRRIMGYELFFYELMDHPTEVEELIDVVKQLRRREYELAVKLDLEIFNICANWSDDIHTPVFKKYFIPWFQEITDFLHARGKLAMVHIDGEMKRLIPLFLDTHIDVAEAWTPTPMTKVTTAELRRAWGDKVTIWGGVPAILFEPTYSDEEFDNYIINLFKEIAPGYNFIVGMGDNLPFDGKIERVRRIAELVDEYGVLPINSV